MFRFGVGIGAKSRTEYREKARQAEDLGYDVVLQSDHLGMVSPFPALITMAEATERIHVGTMVLNAGFHRPALLARDVASVDMLTDGRMEFGIGAGPDFAKSEFEAAGLPFPSGRERVDYLERAIGEIRELHRGDHQPAVTRRIPVLVGGHGDRLVRVAACNADIVSLVGVPVGPDIDSVEAGVAALGRRVDYIREAAGPRFADLELGLMVQAAHVTDNSGIEVDLRLPRSLNPALSDAQLGYLPGVLQGSARDIADTLRYYRDTFGITYFTAAQDKMMALAKVIEQLGFDRPSPAHSMGSPVNASVADSGTFESNR